VRCSRLGPRVTDREFQVWLGRVVDLSHQDAVDAYGERVDRSRGGGRMMVAELLWSQCLWVGFAAV
jgi:hypothetical protein